MTAPDVKPLRLSWSRIKEWEECSERGHLIRQGHRSEVTDVRVFFPGNVVDRCMRAWLETDDYPAGGMARTVAEIMAREEKKAREAGDGIVHWRGPGDKVKVRDWCVEAVTRLEPLLREYVLPFSYQCALRFEVPVSIPGPDGVQREIKLIGEMDLLTRIQGSVAGAHYIWDLKGTADSSYWRKTYPQLIFYEIAAFGLLRTWPEHSGLLQPMCEQPVLKFAFTADHRAEMWQRIVRVANEIWTGQHRPKATSAGCDRCVAKQVCPRFRPVGRRMPLASGITGLSW